MDVTPSGEIKKSYCEQSLQQITQSYCFLVTEASKQQGGIGVPTISHWKNKVFQDLTNFHMCCSSDTQHA